VFDASKCRMVQSTIKLPYHRILLRLPGIRFHSIGIGSIAMMWTQNSCSQQQLDDAVLREHDKYISTL
jgi:hypothetical protein